MRKKPTFDELANATLKENTLLAPLQLPYIPYNSTSQALVDLQALTQQLQFKQQRGEDVQAATVQEARDIGVDPSTITQVAQGIAASTSGAVQQLITNQQNAQAAEQRMNELRHEGLTRLIADTQLAIARNTETQAQTASSLSSVPDRMTAALAAQMTNMPPAAIPDEILQMIRQSASASGGFTLQQFQEALQRFAEYQGVLAQNIMRQQQNFMTQQQQDHGALMGAQNRNQQALMDAQNLNQQALMDAQRQVTDTQNQNMQQTMSSLEQLLADRASSTTALVSQDQSIEMARNLIIRMIQGLMNMFAEAARGQQAMNRDMLARFGNLMQDTLQQFPNVSIQNIDARQLVPMLVNLSMDPTSADSTTNIQNIMNALHVPSNPVSIQNVAQQLAITGPAPLPPPLVSPSTTTAPPLVSPSTTTALELFKAKSPPRVQPRTPITQQGKARPGENQQNLVKAQSILNAGAKVEAVRNQPPKQPPPKSSSKPLKSGQWNPSAPPSPGPLSPYVPDNNEQNSYIMQQRDAAAAAAAASGTPPQAQPSSSSSAAPTQIVPSSSSSAAPKPKQSMASRVQPKNRARSRSRPS